jgi:hypothetical protein
MDRYISNLTHLRLSTLVQRKHRGKLRVGSEIHIYLYKFLWVRAPCAASFPDVDSQASQGREGRFGVSGFVICFLVGLGGSIVYLVQKEKSIKEMSLFVTFSLLGCIVWMGLFLRYKVNPNRWIAWLIDGLGL